MAGHTNLETGPALWQDRTPGPETELASMAKAIRSGRGADVWARIREYNRQTRIAKAEQTRIDARARKPGSGPTMEASLDRTRALAARFAEQDRIDARGRKPTDKEALRGADWLRKWDSTILMASGRYIR